MTIKRSEEIIFYMLPGPGKDTGMDPIEGKDIKTLGTFTCTYDQAFVHGTVADIMREINIPNGLDFYFRPYNYGRVIGLLRKPENPNTLKYFLGKTTDCQNNDQLFVNEIIEYFDRENQKRKIKPFYIKLVRTNVSSQ